MGPLSLRGMLFACLLLSLCGCVNLSERPALKFPFLSKKSEEPETPEKTQEKTPEKTEVAKTEAKKAPVEKEPAAEKKPAEPKPEVAKKDAASADEIISSKKADDEISVNLLAEIQREFAHLPEKEQQELYARFKDIPPEARTEMINIYKLSRSTQQRHPAEAANTETRLADASQQQRASLLNTPPQQQTDVIQPVNHIQQPRLPHDDPRAALPTGIPQGNIHPDYPQPSLAPHQPPFHPQGAVQNGYYQRPSGQFGIQPPQNPVGANQPLAYQGTLNPGIPHRGPSTTARNWQNMATAPTGTPAVYQDPQVQQISNQGIVQPPDFAAVTSAGTFDPLRPNADYSAASTSESEFHATLDKLIRLAEADVRATDIEDGKDAYLIKHVYLRFLYLMADRPGQAIAHIPGIPDAEKEFWKNMVFSIKEYFDTQAIGDESQRAAQALTWLNSAVSKLQSRASLSLRNLVLCDRIEGYGDYNPFSLGTKYSPGDAVLLYVEVENFTSVNENGLFRTELESAIQILTPDGRVVADYKFPQPSVDLCKNYRRDYFHSYKYTLPNNLGPGQHILRLVVEDKTSRRIASDDVHFTVRN